MSDSLDHIDDDTDHDAQSILKSMLEPVMYWLLGRGTDKEGEVYYENIEEIAINRPGEVWVKLRKPNATGKLWVQRFDKKLTRQQLELMIFALSNIGGNAGFGPRETPCVFGTLPGGHRYGAALGPNIQYVSGELSPIGTILFCARQYRPDLNIRFENYGLKAGQPINTVFRRSSDKEADIADPLMAIMTSIKRGDHILISGATGTGKTTFLNHVIRLMNPDLRIISVEDTSEIVIPHPNHVHILLSRTGQSNNFDYHHVVDLVTRITPDVVMAGEVSTRNAATIWELMRSGHGHFLTTIHAEDAREAISTFITRIQHKLEVPDPNELARQMLRKLRVIQIIRDHQNNRRIAEIL